MTIRGTQSFAIEMSPTGSFVGGRADDRIAAKASPGSAGNIQA
jgi:hypothetical protein